MHVMYQQTVLDILSNKLLPDVRWLLTACCHNPDCASGHPSSQSADLKLLHNENKLMNLAIYLSTFNIKI